MNPKKLARTVMPKPAIKLAEKSYRKGRGVAWRARYGFPSRGMKIIGVTGTNGKTTTASYINAMLKKSGFKTAVFTTAFIEVAGQREPNRSHMTVTSQAASQKFLARARRKRVDWVILELTSHALDQGRIDGVKIDIAVVTNLTQEHLDYHKTMENYASAKALLLGKKYRAKYCILNADDDWFDFFATRSVGTVLSFGKKGSTDIHMTGLSSKPTGSELKVRHQTKYNSVKTSLLGEFNAYNALAAYGVGVAVGLTPAKIARGIASLHAVPGRMEQIEAGQKFKVIVDFAITPDALENAIRALRKVTKGRVIVVFGATGDRDKTKRAPMGLAVGALADLIFLTDDETYTEDPASIRAQVYEGIKSARAASKTTEVDDRRVAILKAFKAAKAGDTVLLTGIGHEDYRNMGGKKVVWDERDVAREELKILLTK